MRKISTLLLGILLFFISCETEDDLGFKPIEVGMEGVVQKGPFVSGSSISIQELDNSFVPNGTTYFTTTNDDFGSFSLNSVINTSVMST